MDVLGTGGMGVVYRARQLGLNRLVALKMIREDREAHPGNLTRFMVEAEAVARLAHPNIIQIYDIGTAGCRPFFALELVSGGSLKNHLDGNPQPTRQAAELIESLARAVHAAHQAGIIHRDLKPGNVLITPDGVPKITDFGLAKLLDTESARTFSGQVVGTPSYMAPEQAVDSRMVGPAADVYALGAILYEMLTGRPPFKGETPLETVRQVIEDEPVSPTRLMPRVARDLETICLKCLAKNQRRRYASALALADDLRHFLNGEPIKARPIPFWQRAAKWARRRPAAAMVLAAGALVVLGAFLGVLEYQERRTTQIEQQHARLVREWEAKSAIKEARAEIDRKDLPKAKELLTRLQGKLGLDASMGALIKETQRLLESVKARLDEEDAQERDLASYRSFRERRKQALFQATSFTGLDLATDPAAPRKTAREALKVYATAGSDDTWTLKALPSSLTAPQQADIKAGCYALLLLLAEAEPDPASRLRRLDEAARLRPEATTAYHLRRADYLAKAGDPMGAEREGSLASAQQQATPFDHLRIGQSAYRRGDYSTALEHFNAVLQDQPDDFWAQCISAVCALQLHRPAEAVPRLNACLQSDPDFAWLYLLRGYASSELAAAELDPAHRDSAVGDTGEKIPPQGVEPFHADAGLARANDKKGPSAARETDGARKRADRYLVDAQADYQRARERLASKPNNELQYALWVHQGTLALLRREPGEAAACLQSAIALRPGEVTALAALRGFICNNISRTRLSKYTTARSRYSPSSQNGIGLARA